MDNLEEKIMDRMKEECVQVNIDYEERKVVCLDDIRRILHEKLSQLRQNKSNRWCLMHLCNTISEWYRKENIEDLSKKDLMIEIGNIANLCIMEELNSDQTSRIFNISGSFANK